MDYNDRELLVYRIRSAVVTIKIPGKTIKVKPPSIEDYLESCEEYWRTYDQCCVANIKNQDEMVEWMIQENLWSYHEDKEITQIKEKAEDLKLLCYESRRNQMMVNGHKNTLRAIERRFKTLNDMKYKYYANTCDGIASSAKTLHVVENNTYCGNQLYNFADVSIDSVVMEYNSFHDIEDEMVRYLARTDPWRTIWSTRKNTTARLFFNESDIDLTTNQKSILAWSQMYDSVYESMDSPDKYVVEDDDLLDGWFISETRKREKDKARQDLDGSIKNSKIRNAQEVFSVVNNVEEFKKVESLNSNHSKVVKKQREDLIKKKGVVGQGAFEDEKLKHIARQNQQFKGKFGG